MNAEELLGCLDVEATESSEPSKQAEESNSTEKKRERLSAVVVGGNSKKYLGKELLLSDIDSMKSEQINKLYCKYEARLGASMTKTLGNSFINLYVMSPLQLIKDLEEDPFINHALTNTCCELYYRFGMYLAPFTAILTTARHIDFNTERIGDIEASNKTIENDE